MTQHEINELEWQDPDNWSGPRWLSVYHSARDNRWWVPKQIPWMALWMPKATPNFAHAGAVVQFFMIMTLIVAAAFGLVAVATGKGH